MAAARGDPAGWESQNILQGMLEGNPKIIYKTLDHQLLPVEVRNRAGHADAPDTAASRGRRAEADPPSTVRRSPVRRPTVRASTSHGRDFAAADSQTQALQGQDRCERSFVLHLRADLALTGPAPEKVVLDQRAGAIEGRRFRTVNGCIHSAAPAQQRETCATHWRASAADGRARCVRFFELARDHGRHKNQRNSTQIVDALAKYAAAEARSPAGGSTSTHRLPGDTFITARELHSRAGLDLQTSVARLTGSYREAAVQRGPENAHSLAAAVVEIERPRFSTTPLANDTDRGHQRRQRSTAQAVTSLGMLAEPGAAVGSSRKNRQRPAWGQSVWLTTFSARDGLLNMHQSPVPAGATSSDTPAQAHGARDEPSRPLSEDYAAAETQAGDKATGEQNATNVVVVNAEKNEKIEKDLATDPHVFTPTSPTRTL